jgi:hypothetical protein
MSGIGYKPRGADGPMYNPERDYAYITPTLMSFAVENMNSVESEETKRWKAENEITVAEIERVARALARAQRDFVNANDPVPTMEHALGRHEFYNERHCVRQLLFASIGEIFCAAWFKAVREVSLIGEESPAQTDMARFAATVREFAVSNGIPTYNPNFRAELLQFQNDVLQTRINELGQSLQKATVELASLRESAVQTPALAPKTATGWRRLFSFWSDHA